MQEIWSGRGWEWFHIAVGPRGEGCTCDSHRDTPGQGRGPSDDWSAVTSGELFLYTSGPQGQTQGCCQCWPGLRKAWGARRTSQHRAQASRMGRHTLPPNLSSKILGTEAAFATEPTDSFESTSLAVVLRKVISVPGKLGGRQSWGGPVRCAPPPLSARSCPVVRSRLPVCPSERSFPPARGQSYLVAGLSVGVRL